jgi:hypothetical protein
VSLDKINDVIAYIESPEYLRMVASQQGEFAPVSLLGDEAYAPVPEQHRTAYSPPVRRERRASGIQQLSTRSSWLDFAEALGARTPFRTYGALRSTTHPRTDTGRLPEEYANRYATELPFIDYVVYSYVTPIAWHVWNPGITGVCDPDSYWVYPQHSYSPTTSRHQSKIRVALVGMDEDVRY